MKSKSSAALAAVVALAALSAHAAQQNVGVNVKTVGVFVPAVSAVNLGPKAGFSNALSVAIEGPQSPTVIQALSADTRIQAIMSQEVGAEAAKPGALTAVFDGGSMKAQSESAAVSGAVGAGRAPLSAASSVRTPSSTRLSAIGYGSYSAANGGAFIDLVKRWWNAALGALGIATKKVETPEVMAERYKMDLKTKGEKIKALVAGAAKSVSLLRQQVSAEAAAIKDLSSKRDAALQAGRDDVAMRYDGQLAPLEASHETNKGQLAQAEANLASTKQSLQDYITESENELARISAKLGEVKAKQAAAELAKIKDGMKIGSSEHKGKFDEAVGEAIADAEGTTEASKATGQDDMEEFEREMRDKAAKDRLEQRKKELGLGGTSTDAPPTDGTK